MLCVNCAKDISIHSPRMGRDAKSAHHRIDAHISIHSPRMGRDESVARVARYEIISIHSPRMGRDADGCLEDEDYMRFQSTLPAWGETVPVVVADNLTDISIHSPRMGRDVT